MLGALMRWILLAVTLAAIVLAVVTRSPGWFAAGVIVALAGMLLTAFAFAHSRIGSSARPEELNSFELDQLRQRMREQRQREDDER